MSRLHRVEAALVDAVAGMSRLAGGRGARALGAALGDAVRVAGIRRRVAEDNLARAFPEWNVGERARVLRAHYREVGRIALEYPRLAAMARAPWGEYVMEPTGIEHLERARALGRGVVLMTGHFGNFELIGAVLRRFVPVHVVVRPLSNPYVDRWLSATREATGMGLIAADTEIRRVYQRLRANDAVGMLADQDARRHGVFIPFLGRPASTAIGPARVALATGAPIVMCFVARRDDGRHELTVEPPLETEPDAPDAALRLTRRHVERLEWWVRRRPEHWFWLHRRWKTAPPSPSPGESPTDPSIPPTIEPPAVKAT